MNVLLHSLPSFSLELTANIVNTLADSLTHTERERGGGIIVASRLTAHIIHTILYYTIIMHNISNIYLFIDFMSSNTKLAHARISYMHVKPMISLFFLY